MEKFYPKKKVVDDFNGGEKYVDGDGLQANTINNLVESVLYAQDHIGTGEGSDIALTNYYGESMTEGYTQFFTNGDAQAKNYYNLGVFDEFSHNEDGTVTIIRKTSNLAIDGSEKWSLYGQQLYTDYFSPILKGFSNDSYNVKMSNLYGIFSGTCRISPSGRLHLNVLDGSTTLQECLNALSENNLNLQIETPNSYNEKVIANQPINYFNLVEQNWVNKEYLKTVNIFAPSDGQYSAYGLTYTVSNGECSINGNQSTAGASFDYNSFYTNLKKGVYIISILISGTGVSNVSCYSKSGKIIAYLTQSGAYRFELEEDDDVRVRIGFSDTVNTTVTAKVSCMITKGEKIYPYSPYRGEIVHNKEFKEETNSLSTQLNNKIDSEVSTIKNRLDKLGFKQGSFTVGGVTVPIQRQGNYVYCNYTLPMSKIHAYGLRPETISIIPDGFRPKNEESRFYYGLAYGGAGGLGDYHDEAIGLINEDGSISLLYKKGFVTTEAHVINGAFTFIFGYEAKPL